MQLILDTTNGVFQIRAYEPGRIQINNDWHTSSIIVSPNQLTAPWRPNSLLDIEATDFDTVLALKPELVLLGTGITLSFPSSEILQPFYIHKIGIEIMDTGAACRTYNILMAEGRKVVAALLIQ